MNLASYLDSTNLRPEATENDIYLLCKEAARDHVAAVCIQTCRLPQARKILSGSGVNLGTVIGFPLGAELPGLKKYAAEMALEEGANEIDMVVNLGWVKDRNYAAVQKEVRDVLSLKQQAPFLFKLIVETAQLTKEELIYLIRMLSDTEADFIKTSTGFSTRGASLEDLQIINAHKAKHLKIKASGGIKELGFALELISAGANRLGSSNASKLLEDFQVQGGQ